MDDQTEWRKKQWVLDNTFYCEGLRCYMTERQCRVNMSLFPEGEKIPLNVWLHASSGLKKILSHQRRPPACDNCPKRLRYMHKGEVRE